MRREKDILFILNERYELFSLNNTAYEIYEMALKNLSYRNILDELFQIYNVDYDQLCSDVEEFLRIMIGYSILHVSGGE